MEQITVEALCLLYKDLLLEHFHGEISRMTPLEQAPTVFCAICACSSVFLGVAPACSFAA